MEIIKQLQQTESERVRSEQAKQQNSPQTLAKEAIKGAFAKKATDVTVMDIRGVSGIADFFVLCTGDSPRQIKAIADGIREDVRIACEEKPWHVEGYNGQDWILLDYVDLVVHVFSEEKREFYDLERLWGDAEIVRIEDENEDIPLLTELD